MLFCFVLFYGPSAVTSTFIKVTPCLLVSFQSGEGGGKCRQNLVFPNYSHWEEMDLIFELSAHIQAILSHWHLAMHCLEGRGVKGHGRSWKCFLLQAGQNIYLCPQLFARKIELLKGEPKACCKY